MQLFNIADIRTRSFTSRYGIQELMVPARFLQHSVSPGEVGHCTGIR